MNNEQMKRWYVSKTLWFNVTMTIVELVALAMDLHIGGDQLAVYFAFTHGFGNIILRIWFTNTRLEV